MGSVRTVIDSRGVVCFPGQGLGIQTPVDFGDQDLTNVGTINGIDLGTLADPANTITVDLDGKQYDSIEDAFAYAATLATTNNRMTVVIYPGDYTENNPLTIPDYVSVTCPGSHEVTRMICANTGVGQHAIIGGTDTEVHGLQVQNATGVGSAGFYFPNGIQDCELHDCNVRDCYYGYWSEAGIPNPSVFIRDPHMSGGSVEVAYRVSSGGRMLVTGAVQTGAVTCGTFAQADGAGSILRMFTVSLGGTNTTRTAEVSNTAEMELQLMRVDGCAEGWFVLGTGGQLSIGSSQMTNVAGTHLSLANASNVYGFINDIYFDDDKLVKGAAATLTGIYEASDVASRPGPTAIGEFWLGADPAEQVPLSSYSRATFLTGLVTIGSVSLPGGLFVDVPAGDGFVNTGTGVVKVEWDAETVAIPADADFYIYVDSDGTVNVDSTQGSTLTNITLYAGRATTASIVFIVPDQVFIDHSSLRLYNWIKGNTGLLWLSGMDVTNAGLVLSIGAGSYSSPNEDVSTAGEASAILTRWYRDPVLGWKFSTGDADDGFYDDNSGTLQAIPAGEWKKDSIYVTVDGTETYHYVYAQATYASQILATAASLPVPPALFQVGDLALVLAGTVIEQGGGTVADITDERPSIGVTGPGAGAPATDHGSLLGLGDDDHSRYLDKTGNAARNSFTGVLDASGGGIKLPTSATPTQTGEGEVVWDSDDDVLTVGDGATRKTLVGTTATQTLTNKTLDAPAVSDYVDYTPVVAPAHAEGRVFYDTSDRTLNVHVEGNSTLQIGQESYVRARNNTGGPLSDGKVVYVSGAAANRPTIAYADADASATSEPTLGVLTQNVANGVDGTVTILGLVRDIDASGNGGETWNPGDYLWVSSTAGDMTNVLPPSPSHAVRVGMVLNNNAINGIILVAPLNYPRLEELHNVLISGVADGEVLTYDAGSGLWKNEVVPPPSSHIIETATLQTLSATSPTTITSMTYTPPAGTYNIMFEAEIQGGGKADMLWQIYKDAVAVGNSRRRTMKSGSYGSVSIQSQVTVTGAEVITVKAQVTASSVLIRGRSVTFTRVTTL